MEYVELLRTRPIVLNTIPAHEQVYEVATRVLQAMTGPRMKYSACLYEKGGETLAQAEVAMLGLCAERGEVRDGMRILDLGYVFAHFNRTLNLYLLGGDSSILITVVDVAGVPPVSTSPKSFLIRASRRFPSLRRKRSMLTLLPRERAFRI